MKTCTCQLFCGFSAISIPVHGSPSACKLPPPPPTWCVFRQAQVPLVFGSGDVSKGFVSLRGMSEAPIPTPTGGVAGSCGRSQRKVSHLQWVPRNRSCKAAQRRLCGCNGRSRCEWEAVLETGGMGGIFSAVAGPCSGEARGPGTLKGRRGERPSASSELSPRQPVMSALWPSSATSGLTFLPFTATSLTPPRSPAQTHISHGQDAAATRAFPGTHSWASCYCVVQ